MRGAAALEVRTRRSMDRLVETGALPRRGWHDAAAWALAASIGLIWLAVGASGMALFLWAHPVWWVPGGVLVMTAVLLRPRPLRLDESSALDDPRAAVQSPAVDAALGALAAELPTRPPDVVFVTLSPDIALVRDSFGRRRVLLVGMPLWLLLDDGARRAAVAHELGHERYRDPRRVGLASLAERWLVQWSVQLGERPGSDKRGRPADELAMADPLVGLRVMQVGARLGAVQSTTNLVAALSRGAVQAAARLLGRLTFVPHQRVELQADAVAVRVAGPDAVRRLLAVEPLRRRAGMSARQALLRTDGVDLAATVVAHVQALPDHQRRALDTAVTGDEVRSDQPHLPVRLRRELVDRLPTAPCLPVPDDGAWRAASQALATAFAPLERELRRQAQQSGRQRRRPAG